MKISIAHLYPKLLNLYGDIGNIIALKQRCEWRGIFVEVNEIDISDKIEAHDFYFIAGGQDKQQEDVAFVLSKNKEFLTEERDNGAVFLGVCGGYQLLGDYYKSLEGRVISSVGLLDVYTEIANKRFAGNVTIETDFLTPKTLVGFENHNGLTYLQGETKPLGSVLVGNGNNGVGKTEGARYKNVFGTYMHGSLLPKNPHFADYLIELALEKRYGQKFELQKLDDFIEVETHKSLVGKAY